MKRTLTISIAGRASVSMKSWLQWEQLVNDMAMELRLSITHSLAEREGGRAKKFALHRPLNSSGTGRPIVRYSLASVPPRFVTVIQDADLYADRACDGLYVIVAVPARRRPGEFVAQNRKLLEGCMERIEGRAAFMLPPSELAANYAYGMNDVRECKKAKVLFYEPGGFLPG